MELINSYAAFPCATHKDGVHGFGLRRAEAILEEHGGWVKYNSEDGAFTSEFLVPAIE